MGDMHEAGRKAWATRQLNDALRVRDIYRDGFRTGTKSVARQRAIRALQAAGGTVCLDFWGGGLSADALVSAGFSVVSVEDGEYGARLGISRLRSRRAIDAAAADGGYVSRFGKAARFAKEADVAWLDFCGPWSKEVRRTVEACRHMKAVVITLTSDHDAMTEATTVAERQAAYEVYLRLAFGGRSTHGGGIATKRLCSYSRHGGQRVFVFVVSKASLKVAPLGPRDLGKLHRSYMTPMQRQAERERARRLYARRKNELNARHVERKRERRATDPEYVLSLRHIYHVKVARFFSNCSICQAAGQVLPAGRLMSRTRRSRL